MTNSTNYVAVLSKDQGVLLCSWLRTALTVCYGNLDFDGGANVSLRIQEVSRKAEQGIPIAMTRDEAELFPGIDFLYAYAD